MTDAADYEPPLREIDTDKPSVARVYDYLLGGTENWAIDRQFADRMTDSYPLVRDMARANRMFLCRVVRYLALAGVQQFLDIGSGMPTMGSTHQIAQSVNPDARVVYVDHEPVAVAHAGGVLLEQNAETHATIINADLRGPRQLWRLATDTGLLDPSQPVAVLVIAVLHVQQPGPDGHDIGPDSVAALRDLMAPGSYLAISHATDDGVPDDFKDHMADIHEMYRRAGSPVVWRTRPEVQQLLGNLALVNPGMCWTPEWHPEIHTDHSVAFATPNQSIAWAGVGHKPMPLA